MILFLQRLSLIPLSRSRLSLWRTLVLIDPCYPFDTPGPTCESGQEAEIPKYSFLLKNRPFYENSQKFNLEAATSPPGLRDGQGSDSVPLCVSTNSIRGPEVDFGRLHGVGLYIETHMGHQVPPIMNFHGFRRFGGSAWCSIII